MNFRLVPNWVTLDNLERLNSPNHRVISPNSVAFGADCVKVVGDTPVLSAAEMQATESSFYGYIIYGDIGKGHPSESNTRSSATAKSTARPSCLVGVLYDIYRNTNNRSTANQPLVRNWP